ncbi:unnamed protein product, partial [marine sediment metagenome]
MHLLLSKVRLSIQNDYNGYTSGDVNIQRLFSLYINMKNYNKSYDVLQYMKKYYTTEQKIINGKTVAYFYKYILVNYHVSSNRFLDEDVLLYFMETTDEKITEMLYMNIYNLRLYENTK